MKGFKQLTVTACMITAGIGCTVESNSVESETLSSPLSQRIQSASRISDVRPVQPQLRTQVQIERDDRGIPHIEAKSLEAALYGLGYTQAEDRLFQMFQRRTKMEGRLSEFFGIPGTNATGLLESDITMRILGYDRFADKTAQSIPERHRLLLVAYANGVNDQIRARRGDLGEAFDDFGIESIDPWTAADSILVWESIGHTFGNPLGDMMQEIKLVDACSDGDCIEGCVQPIDEAAAVVPEPTDGIWPPMDDSGRIASFERLPNQRPPVSFKASHAFVVAGDRTASGSPMLFGEPQIIIERASTWHEFHLVVANESVDVRGVSPAGAPGVMIFWNRHVSQTLTAGKGDVADLFELAPGRSADTYQLDGKDVPYQRRNETINVLGGPSVSLEVLSTHFGPIVNQALASTTNNPQLLAIINGQNYAMRHVSRANPGSHSILAALDLMSADSLATYRQALSHWAVPTVNALYAGIDAGTGEDHIAYHAIVAIPERPVQLHGALDVTGRYPQDGSSTRNDWGPVYDLNWSPHLIDPPQGYILNGNSLAVGAWYDDFVYAGIGGNGDTYRSLQIRKKLEALFANDVKVSERTLHGLHVNAESWAASQVLEILSDLETTGVIPPYDPNLVPTTRSEKAARVLRGLARWSTEGGGLLDQRSVGAPLAADVLGALTTRAREEPFSCSWGGAEGGASFFLKAYADDPSVLGRIEINAVLDVAATAWDDITSTHPGENDPTIYPNDVNTWAGRTTPLPSTIWYQRNFMCFWSEKGACSSNPSMDVEIPINQSYIPTINSAYGSSYPVSVFFHDIDKSRALLPPGNSERPSSRFSLDAVRAITAKGNGNITSIPQAPLSAQGRQVTSKTTLYFP